MSRLVLGVWLWCTGSIALGQYTISTYAGGNVPSNVRALDIPLSVNAVVIDPKGDLIAADQFSVYRIAANGNLTVVAGRYGGTQGDGRQADLAHLSAIGGIAVDSAGNVYISETDNNRIRKVDGRTGLISTVAAGTEILGPVGLAVDSADNLYIAEAYSHRVRKLTASTGVVTVVAGTGTAGFSGDGGRATAAQLNGPRRLIVDRTGNLYIFETFSPRVRRVSIDGNISTYAGVGTPGYSGDNLAASRAELSSTVGGLGVDAFGNLYIADTGNHRVRLVRRDTGMIATIAGNGNPAFSGDNSPPILANLNSPAAVAVDGNGDVIVADLNNARIRKITAGIIRTIAGGGSGGDGGAAVFARLSSPGPLAVAMNGDLLLNDCGSSRIRRINPFNGIITTIAGVGYAGFSGDRGPAVEAALNGCGSLAADASGDVYFADVNNFRIRRVRAVSGEIDTAAGTGREGFAGDGEPAASASIRPTGAAVDANGVIYIAEGKNARIRWVTQLRQLRTFAGDGTPGFGGDGGPADRAQIGAQLSIAVASDGSVYFADTQNNRIRRVTTAGVISTIAGTGAYGHDGDGGPALRALLAAPTEIAIDRRDNIYFLESALGYVRRIDRDSGFISTIAGGGTGGDGGVGTAAFLSFPSGLAVDQTGNVFVSEPRLNRIRKLVPPRIAGLEITTASPLPEGTVGQNYSVKFSASAGAPPYGRWELAGGRLPAGMRLEADGILSGTPSEPGNFELTVRVSDAAGAVAAKAFVLNVRSAPISFSREGVVNAASFLPGPVSPFEIVTVYGLGFGPPEPAAAIWEGPGTLATTVAGTRVYFDGVPAPIVHVMSGQVSVAVPDLPEAVSTTDVVLEYRGVRSARAEVSVAAVSPGIFTANGGGSGQVAALNTDGTYNSSANPVERGGVLVLYGTGFGRLRASDPPVSVTIGGIMTDVVYAGPIAGHIRGLTQINVAVPLSVEPGDRVPISVAAGERQSQSGLTIAVR